MAIFIGKRAVIEGQVLAGAVILGPTRIERGSFIDSGTLLGYPARDKLLRAGQIRSYETLDELSAGCYVGPRCIVRSGSVIYEQVNIDEGVELGHGVLIRSGSRVGRSTRIGSYAQLEGEVTGGEESSIQSMVYLPHKSKIGKSVFMGPGVCVTNDRYPPSRRLAGVVIEDEAVIGAYSVIMAGIRIGRRAVVAAGSIVTRDVAPGDFVLGSPARRVGSRDDYDAKRRAYEAGI